MLKLAYTYNQQLQDVYSTIIFQDKYKFWNCSNYWAYELKLDNDSWNCIALVSVDKNDNILGYFRASISKCDNKVSGLGIMNFYDKNITFSKDLRQFLSDLFEKYNFRKIEFEVVIGNPAEIMYDKYTNKYGGRIVGINKKSVKLQDGLYYDTKYYEIFKEDYVLNKK